MRTREEFSGSRDVIINGHVVGAGRTVAREDGSYVSYDLKDAQEGDVLTLLTDQGAHELKKVGTAEHEAAVRGWILGEKTVEIALHDSQGFRTPSIVVRNGVEVYVQYPESDAAHITHRLGEVANIAVSQQVDESEKVAA
jgi:hypothetical protein